MIDVSTLNTGMNPYLYSDIADLFEEWYFQVETYECNLDFVQDKGIDTYAEFYCWS